MSTNIKETLLDTYLQLVEEKGYTKVSIIDITTKCNASRQTFYYHFKNLNDLLEWAFEHDTRRICNEINENDAWTAVAIRYFDMLRKYEKLMKDALNSNKCLFIIELLKKSVSEFVRAYINNKKSAKISDFIITCAIYSITEMTIEELSKDDTDFYSVINEIKRNLKNGI